MKQMRRSIFTVLPATFSEEMKKFYAMAGACTHVFIVHAHVGDLKLQHFLIWEMSWEITRNTFLEAMITLCSYNRL